MNPATHLLNNTSKCFDVIPVFALFLHQPERKFYQNTRNPKKSRCPAEKWQ